MIVLLHSAVVSLPRKGANAVLIAANAQKAAASSKMACNYNTMQFGLKNDQISSFMSIKVI